MPSKVLVREPGEGKSVAPWTAARLYAAVGWVGVVLAAAALADYALAFFPTAFSSMEWEFGTISQIFAGLPLLWIGLACIWVSGAMAGRQWVLLTIGIALVLAAVIVLVLLVAFALDVPVALKTTQAVARRAVEKAILKTVFMGVLFAAAFAISGVLALSQARPTSSGRAAS